jgi:predicted enzyme related to lactoylglutathione lyase
MTIRTTPWPAGTPCWVDMSVADLDAAKAFYGPVVGWEFADTGEEFGHYTLCQRDGHSAAAISPVMPGAPGPVPWTVYLASDDATATAKLVAENGGSLLVEPMEIPGMGVMAVAVDPTGGAFGVWQAHDMVGFEIANEPGGVTWTDVRLTDPEAGSAFYSAVFGWTYQPVPGAPTDYGTIHLAADGDPVGGLGGMMGAPEGTPSHWLTYFSVADVDAADAQATALGANALMAPTTSPFGRMGIYTDPTGAVFALHQTVPDA